MKVTFIYPRFEKFLENIPDLNLALIDHFLGNFTTPPSLGIPILAGLTPSDWDIELIDDNNGDHIDYDAKTDLVAINCFTPQATRAFQIADGYRAAGKTVIMGGFFPSAMPDEALKHADSVNIGDGEPHWLSILDDVNHSLLKPRYVGGSRFNLADLPPLRRDLFYEKSGYDWDADLVQTARGCLYTCGMCAIPEVQGHRIRFRDVEDIVNEVRGLRFQQVYLAEDILFFPNRRILGWARTLFKSLAPLNKHLFVSSTLSLNTSNEILDLMKEGGVKSFYCTLNVDPKSIRALGGDKGARDELKRLINQLEERDIRFFASFGMGRDWDGESRADDILELCEKCNIRTAEFFLFTPFPGSTQWHRLERQGRLIHRDWHKYNGAHVVWKPLGTTPEKLYESFAFVWREFYDRLVASETVENLEPDQSEAHMALRRQRARNERSVV